MRWQSFCHALSPPFSWLPLLFFYFKTRALFRPFHRFHLSVVVQVGAEVAMSRHFCFRIVHQQSADQYAERVALPFRACVFGIPIVVQSAFIGDSDRVGIVAAGVGAGPLDRAGESGFVRHGGCRNDSPCHQIHVGGARLPELAR